MKRKLLVILILLFSASAFANKQRTIELTSTGSVSVRPNLAVISIGVETNANSANEAASENAKKLSAVVKALQPFVKNKNAINTTSYAVMPVYRYDRKLQQNLVAGYRASNEVVVKSKQLDKVGKMIDAVVNAGSNKINNLSFQHDDSQKFEEQALEQAVKSGMHQAELIAKASNNEIAKLINVSLFQAPQPYPVYARKMSMASESGSPSTPVEANSLEIKSQVRMIFSIKDAGAAS